jgi:hypothetical protein
VLDALQRLGRFFLVVFTADAGLSFLDFALKTGGSPGLAGLRAGLATLAVAGALWVWVALALSPRLPKRVFLPPVLFCVWWSFGAAPLPLLLDSPAAVDAAGIAIQLVVAGFAWTLRGRAPAAEPSAIPPAYSWRSTLTFLAANAVLGPPLLAASIVLGLAAGLEARTGHFVSFHRDELKIDDRRYQRGEREVRLVATMHIGEEGAYRELFDSFREPGSVVLAEGVTDETGVLPASFSYENLAASLGLVQQPDLEVALGSDGSDLGSSSEPQPEIRHADVDASTFSPETRAFLAVVGEMLSASDLAAASEILRNFSEREDARQLVDAFEQDVLKERNAHLLAELDRALAETPGPARVVVPWGALHMLELEQAVIERGFRETSRSSRTLVRYETLWRALREAEAARSDDPASQPGGGSSSR